MKRQKRDPLGRAFERGYSAGLDGKSKQLCPKQDGPEHQEWMNGWREGRGDLWSGMRGASAVAKHNKIVIHHMH